MERQINLFIPFKARLETVNLFRRVLDKDNPLMIEEGYEYLVKNGFIRGWNLKDIQGNDLPIALESLQELDLDDAQFIIQSVLHRLFPRLFEQADNLPKG